MSLSLRTFKCSVLLKPPPYHVPSRETCPLVASITLSCLLPLQPGLPMALSRSKLYNILYPRLSSMTNPSFMPSPELTASYLPVPPTPSPQRARPPPNPPPTRMITLNLPPPSPKPPFPLAAQTISQRNIKPTTLPTLSTLFQAISTLPPRKVFMPTRLA